MFGVKHLPHNLCFLLWCMGQDWLDYMNHTGPHFWDLLQSVTCGRKKECCSCCKCKELGYAFMHCCHLAWCEATGWKNNSCITISNMYHNWTSHALYNWSNIIHEMHAWLCFNQLVHHFTENALNYTAGYIYIHVLSTDYSYLSTISSNNTSKSTVSVK